MEDLFSEDDLLFLAEDAELASQVSESDLGDVQKLGDRLVKLEALKKRLEDAAKKVGEGSRQISDDLLPKRLMEIGLMSFTLSTGETISVEHIVSANMPKVDADPAKFEKAVRWLEDHGVGDIVKKDVVAKFGRGDGELAKRVMDRIIQETNGNIPVDLKESVNYQTLNSVLKQRMRDGQELPNDEDGFSIYVGPRAKVKKPKK